MMFAVPSYMIFCKNNFRFSPEALVWKTVPFSNLDFELSKDRLDQRTVVLSCSLSCKEKLKNDPN